MNNVTKYLVGVLVLLVLAGGGYFIYTQVQATEQAKQQAAEQAAMLAEVKKEPSRAGGKGQRDS